MSSRRFILASTRPPESSPSARFLVATLSISRHIRNTWMGSWITRGESLGQPFLALFTPTREQVLTHVYPSFYWITRAFQSATGSISDLVKGLALLKNVGGCHLPSSPVQSGPVQSVADTSWLHYSCRPELIWLVSGKPRPGEVPVSNQRYGMCTTPLQSTIRSNFDIVPYRFWQRMQVPTYVPGSRLVRAVFRIWVILTPIGLYRQLPSPCSKMVRLFLAHGR